MAKEKLTKSEIISIMENFVWDYCPPEYMLDVDKIGKLKKTELQEVYDKIMKKVDMVEKCLKTTLKKYMHLDMED